MNEATDLIYKKVGKDAEVIWGQSIDENIGDEMRVVVAVVPNQLDSSLQ
jgi:cell division protein FtsZ